MQETYTINGKAYPVESYTETPGGQKAPILDVKWMSDIKWGWRTGSSGRRFTRNI